MTQHNIGSSSSVDAAAAAGVSRRRLIRAGLSAAPVVAALQSNTVLASGSGHGGGTCIKPSSFASYRAANGQHSRWDKESLSCKDFKPEAWGHKSHYKCKDEKLSKCGLTIGDKVSLKWRKEERHKKDDGHKRDGWKESDMTFHDLFTEDGIHGEDLVLARYVAACYAHADQTPYDTDSHPLTKGECKAIWRTAGSGWTPAHGGQPWSKDQTMAFFAMLFG